MVSHCSHIAIGGVAPSITHPPQSTSVALNSSVNLTCTAQGAPQVSHHWLKGGVELPGETGPHLVLERVRVEDRGEYSCKAENSLGQQVSELALLTIESEHVHKNHCDNSWCPYLV